MDRQCEICKAILDGRYVKSGYRCPDCIGNDQLAMEFEWYTMLWKMRRSNRVFIPLQGATIFVGAFFLKIRTMGMLVCLLMLLVAIWSYRKRNYGKLLALSRDKMFVAKVSGDDASI